jgi:hypothetical protein
MFEKEQSMFQKRTSSTSTAFIIHRSTEELSVGMDYAYIDYEGNIVKEIDDDIKTTDGRFD